MYINLQALLATSGFEGFDTFNFEDIEAHGEEAHKCRMAFVTEATIEAANQHAGHNGNTWILAWPGDLIVTNSVGSDGPVFERIRNAAPRALSIAISDGCNEHPDLVPFLGADLVRARNHLRKRSRTEPPLELNLLRILQQLEDVIIEIAEEPGRFHTKAAELVLLEQAAGNVEELGWNLYGNEFVNKIIADQLKADFARHYPIEAWNAFPVAKLRDVLWLAKVDTVSVALCAASEGWRLSLETQALRTVLAGLTNASDSQISTAALTHKQADQLDLALRRERLTGGWCDVIKSRVLAAVITGQADSDTSAELYACQGCDLLVIWNETTTGADDSRVYSWPTAMRHKVVEVGPDEANRRWGPKVRRLLALSPEEGLSDSDLDRVLCLTCEDG